METTIQDSRHGSVDVQDNNLDSSNNTKLIDKIDIDDTPFTAVKIQDKWMLTMGKYRMSEMVDSYQEVYDMTADVSWNRLVQVMTVVATTVYEMEKAKETNIQ